MTDTWTLPMTADEICEMYRTAKSRAKQVGILAELNATSKERIVEILTAGGYKVDGRATRYLKAEGSDTSSVSLAADTFPSRGRPRGERAVEDAGPYDGGEAADTHTHTPRAAPPEPITVGRLLLALAEIPQESLVLIGEEPMMGIAFSRALNMQTGEEQQLLTLV